MGFKLLRLICTIGRWLAITPSSIDTLTEPLYQKIYILTVFILLSYGLIMTIINNNFFRNEVYTKIIVAYLTEFNLYIFSFYIMIVLNIYRRQLWHSLMQNLKIVKNKTKKTRKEKSKISYYFLFLCYLFLYLCGEFYIDYKWFIISGREYFSKFNVRLIQLFFITFYKFLWFEIVDTVRVRYKRVQKNLQNKISIYNLQKQVKILCLLRKTLNIFSEIFQFPIVLVVCFTTFEFLNYILFALYVPRRLSLFESVVLAILRLGPTIVSIFFFLMSESNRNCRLNSDFRVKTSWLRFF